MESCHLDVLQHFNSQHNSRLNLTLRPFVDSLFGSQEKGGESSSQDEEFSCDEKSSNLDQNLVSTASFQADELKQSDLEKILEFISRNTKESQI